MRNWMIRLALASVGALAACDREPPPLGGAPKETSVPKEKVGAFRGRAPLSGHAAEVSAVAVSPDGRFFASGSIDKSVKLWDAAAAKELRALAGHTAGVYSVAFSPCGRFLASGGGDPLKSARPEDFTIRVWDLAAGGEIRALPGHANIVAALAFSPFGGVLASGSHDGTVRVWDLTSGRQIQQITGSSSAVWSVAFSPDARLLAVGGQGEIRFLATDGYREVGKVREHSDFVSALAFSGDGAVLASASFDKTVKIWDMSERKVLRTLSGHTESVSTIALTRDGKLVASGGYDKTVRLWEVAGGTQLKSLEGHTGWVASLAFTPDGRTLVSGSGDKSVRVWSVD